MNKIKYLILIMSLSFSNSFFAQDSNTTYGNQAGVNISTGDYLTILGDSTGYNFASSLSENYLMTHKRQIIFYNSDL